MSLEMFGNFFVCIIIVIMVICVLKDVEDVFKYKVRKIVFI